MNPPIDSAAEPPATLAEGASSDFQPLHPRARTGMRIGAMLGFLLPVLVLTVVTNVLHVWLRTPLGLLVFALVLLAALFAGWRYGTARWRHTGWRLDGSALEIRRGVFWRHRIRVPRARVQHTDLQRGPLDRRWDMADLVVFTAGSENAAVRLAGLPASEAQALRDALLQGHDAQL